MHSQCLYSSFFILFHQIIKRIVSFLAIQNKVVPNQGLKVGDCFIRLKLVIFRSKVIDSSIVVSIMVVSNDKAIFVLFLIICVVSSKVLNHTAFVIMSQHAHDIKASAYKNALISDLSNSGVESPIVILLHEELLTLGSWSILPITKPLLNDYSSDIEWFVFLHEASTIDVKTFGSMLEEYDPKQDIFLGKALHDTHPTIIHYYEENLDMTYPDFSAGFVLSRSIVKRLSEQFDLEVKLPLSKIEHSKRKGYTIGM